MKYYIGDYWAMANSCNPEIREEGKTRWVETAKEYGPYFETIRDKLPKGFMKEFDKNNWFHDFTIDIVNIVNIGKKTSTIEFHISHGESGFIITLSGVTGISVNIPNTECWLFGKLTWGYTEFELIDEKKWIVRILCDIECELEIHFRRISIKKLSANSRGTATSAITPTR